jgi:hypothetical protein
MGTITAIVSDTHIGGNTALSLHEWNCDTGLINTDGTPMMQKYQATIAQDWIYECWLDYWAHVKTLAGKKNRIVVIHLGDVIDGDHRNNNQAMPNISDQKNMAVEILKPVSNMADSFYVFRGTQWHTGAIAGDETMVAQELGATSLWEAIVDVDGVLMDCAHHGRAGSRLWYSLAGGIAIDAISDAVTDVPARQIPRYVFRGHMHRIDDSGEKIPGTRALTLPSWQLKTEFGHQVGAGRRTDIGGVIVLPDGSLDLSKLRYFAAPGHRKVVKA